MRKIKILAFILISFILLSCEDSVEVLPYNSSFSGEFVKRKRGLKSLLSDEFVLVQLKDGKELKRKIGFNLDSGMNYLIDAESSDTLDQFIVLRNKKIHYLVRGKYPEVYTIQAIQIKSDSLLGWNSGRDQMKIIDEMVESQTIGLDTLDSKYNLAAEKKRIYEIYSKILAESKIEYIIKRIGKEYNSEIEQSDSLFVASNISDEDQLNTSPIKVYPIPANDQLTVEFEETGLYNIEIIGLDGNLEYKNQLAGDEIHIPVSDIDNGQYLLLIKNSENYIVANQNIAISR